MRTLIALLLIALSIKAAEIDVANVPTTNNVAATDYLLSVVGTKTRLLQITNAPWRMPDTNAYIWIDAGFLLPTNYIQPQATNSFPTNSMHQLGMFSFDSTEQEPVYWQHAMPDNWDRGTLKAKFYWITTEGGTNASTTNGVRWQLDVTAVPSGGFFTNAVGTAQSIEQTNAAPEALNITPATPAITVGGSPTIGDLLCFRVMRVQTTSLTNIPADIMLRGVAVQYQIGTNSAIW